MKKLLSSLICLCSLHFLGCSTETQISGEAFIVNNNKQSNKLSLVSIYLIPENNMLLFSKPFDNKIEEYKPKIKNLFSISDKHSMRGREIFSDTLNKIYSFEFTQRSYDYQRAMKASCESTISEYYEKRDTILSEYKIFKYSLLTPDEIPKPNVFTKTDSNGQFSMNVKTGKYALLAFSDSETEKYIWMIWITVGRGSNNKILLSNDNLADTFCAECIIQNSELKKYISIINGECQLLIKQKFNFDGVARF